MAATIADVPVHGAFLRAAGADAERLRRRAIVAAHPEIRALIGENPYSALLVVALVVVQLATAAALARG
ncbi:MAG TPA: hypothetical protein VIW69_14475, partial [Candidatus Elarobacter sp.]